MLKFEKVKYTKPFELLFLIVSAITLFIGTISICDLIINIGYLKIILALSIAVLYFTFLKTYIVKETDFELTENQLKWGENRVEFKNIEYYKFHWFKGAGVKIKMKNGKVFRISSNENFCDSSQFVKLCIKIESNLKKNNHDKILRKYSFFETKNGYYFAITITTLSGLAILSRLLTKSEFKLGSLGLLLFSISTIWSGVLRKKK